MFIAKDIVQLPSWLRRLWAGFNVRPDGGVSEELIAAPSACRTKRHAGLRKHFCRKALSQLQDVANEKLEIELFRSHELVSELLERAHRFRAVDENGLFSLAKDLNRLIVERIDSGALRTHITPPNGEKWGSLKLLENLLALKYKNGFARKLLTPLVGVNELRVADAPPAKWRYRECFQYGRS